MSIKDTIETELIEYLWQMDMKKSKMTAFSNLGDWKNGNINIKKEVRRLQFQEG